VNILSTLASNEKSSERTIPKQIIQLWTFVGFEASVWILGLLYLAFIHSPEVTHFTICPLANLGIEFCPGCGLGNSISYIFIGDLSSSIYSHPLGIFALVTIIIRIITIIKNNRRKYA
jgi:hypothetical protein